MGVVAVFGSLLRPTYRYGKPVPSVGCPKDWPKRRDESHAGNIVACLISLSAMVVASHMHVAIPST